MGLNGTSSTSSNTAFPLGNQSRADGNKSADATQDASTIEEKKTADKTPQEQSAPVEMGNKADVFSSSSKSSADSSSEKSDTSEKKPKEMPWYLSLGKSLVVMAASAVGMLAGGLRYGIKGAVAGYMVAGAATGGAINALYQKSANGKIEKNELFKNILIGAAGF